MQMDEVPAQMNGTGECGSEWLKAAGLRPTRQRMALADQIDDPAEPEYGYLTQVPFLRHVPPQVQLDLLVETSGGYPYFLQEWGYHVWDHAHTSPITAEANRSPVEYRPLSAMTQSVTK